MLLDLAITFYAVLALGTVHILWVAGRTPIDASVHRLRAPKLDPGVTALHLSDSSDVGVI